MVQLSNEVFAARRAQWLAELSGALGEARRLMRELDFADARGEAIELCSQIDALRREVDAMQLRRVSRDPAHHDPEWMKSPWHPADPVSVAEPRPPKSGAGCEFQVDA